MTFMARWDETIIFMPDTCTVIKKIISWISNAKVNNNHGYAIPNHRTFPSLMNNLVRGLSPFFFLRVNRIMPATTASNYRRVTHSIHRNLHVSIEIRSTADDDHPQRMWKEEGGMQKSGNEKVVALVKAIWNLESDKNRENWWLRTCSRIDWKKMNK